MSACDHAGKTGATERGGARTGPLASRLLPLAHDGFLAMSRRAGTSSDDVIVVGGGLVGAAIAHGLTRAGLAVTVLDEGDVAFRASRGNFGLAWIQGKGVDFPAYTRLTRDAAALWPAFADELAATTGVAIDYRQPGGFDLCLSEAELEARRVLLRRLHNQHPDDCYPTEMLDQEEVRARLPEVGAAVIGASFCPEDGLLNPLYLLHALHHGAQAEGARYLPGRRVGEIRRDGAGFAVETGGEVLRAGRVVLAAGLDNRRLAPMVGLDAPVAPSRGQVLVTQRLPRFLDHVTVSIRQNPEGTVMIGGSEEEVGFDTRTSGPVLAELAAHAAQVFPRLADAQLVRAWAALRVMPLDGHPIYDQSPSMPGAFVTCCHSGVTLAPVHALRIAPAIAEDRLGERYGAFSGARFDVPRAS
jgi:glycine/D-amino acid oxidase-like deaminating enzyme